MKEFDLIVIGAGSGLSVSSAAASKGLNVAVVEEGPFGGTCLNRGCIPSKILVHTADVAEIIRNSEIFNINSEINDIDFPAIVERVFSGIDEDAKSIEKGNENNDNITVFKERGKFVDDKVLKVGNEKITADKIVIAAGTRPGVPPIDRIDDVPYITSKEALRLDELPKSMIIVGGGFIAAELAHFFGALGTDITIVQRNVRLVPNEDSEIGEKFTEIFKGKYNILLEHTAKSVSHDGNEFTVTAEEKNGEKETELKAEQLLIATGRKPNTDILNVEKTGVKTNKYGYVETNEFMETSVDGIYALGDIAGVYLFKHSANLEASYVTKNILTKNKTPVDYTAMPHAVFSSPQIAGVGKTEDELKDENIEYSKGKYEYKNTGMGEALQEKEGFVKVLANPESGEILGCHIIGPEASTLIHEVIIAMKHANNVNTILNSVHIHPALSEVVQRAFGSIEW